jgi:hypothetical protein
MSLLGSYLSALAICIIQHFPEISAPVAVLAIKNHQAHLSFMHNVFSFDALCPCEAIKSGHIFSCIISPHRENKTMC